MAIQAHKVIDILLRRKGQLNVAPSVNERTLQGWAEKIRLATKFEFVRIPLELQDGAYEIPRMTPDEEEMIVHRMVPLPSDVVWYEMNVEGPNKRACILVYDYDGAWHCQRYSLRDDMVSVDPVIVLVGTNEKGELGYTCSFDSAYERDCLLAGRNIATDMQDFHASAGAATCYLTLMLNSRTTETSVVERIPKLAKAQERRGHTPHDTYRVVTIAPRSYTARGPGDGTHSSPRLHWRRAHIRHFDRQTPGSKYYPEKEHKGTKGWWCVPVPRMLVGKAELGTVTHDYRVL